jgi:hypothetical protein
MWTPSISHVSRSPTHNGPVWIRGRNASTGNRVIKVSMLLLAMHRDVQREPEIVQLERSSISLPSS